MAGVGAVELVSCNKAQTYALAFAENLPFLAAGTPPGATTGPRLTIFAPCISAPDVGLHHFGANFPAPASICCIAWSKPTDAGSASWSACTGLIAGGLENGQVAIWDPRSQLRNVEGSNHGWTSGFEVIQDYFSPEGRRKPPRQTITNSNLLAAGSSATSHGAVRVWDQPTSLPEVQNSSGWEPELIEMDDYFPPERPRKPHCPDTAGSSDTSGGEVLAWDWPPSIGNSVLSRSSEWGRDFRLNCSPSRLDSAADDSTMIALFSNQLSPVRGLSFSLSQPNLLASSTSNGRILIDDLTSGKSIHASQCSESNRSEMLSISWSPSLTNVVASTSFDGAYIWDITAKSPLIRNFQSKRKFCAIEWSPTNANAMIVAADDCINETSILIFDQRMMEKPVNEFCKDSGGVMSMSWCPYQDKLIISCRNKKLLLWNMKNQQGLWSDYGLDERHFTDVQWSKTSIGLFAATSGESISLYSVKGDVSQD